MSQKDEPALFKARVNLVQVPVVVRDRQGKAIGSLKKEDFLLFDKGKPQYIAANRQSGIDEKVCLIVTVRSNARSGGEPDPPDSPPIPIEDPPPKPQTNPPAPVREPGPTPPTKR